MIVQPDFVHWGRPQLVLVNKTPKTQVQDQFTAYSSFHGGTQDEASVSIFFRRQGGVWKAFLSKRLSKRAIAR